MKGAQRSYSLRAIIGMALFCTVTVSALAAPHESPESSAALDKQIAATLSSLAHGDIQEAQVLARQMARRFPKYALAHLLSAELDSTAAFQDVRAADLNPMSQQLIDLLSEAQTRLKSAQRESANPEILAYEKLSVLPDSIIQMGKGFSSLLIVDLEESTINHIVGNEKAHTLIRQHYIGSGKGGYGKRLEGDNKTPLGVYTITGRRADSTLPDLYGSGALTLNYPNALDRYLGRTGYGIWIHGVPHALRSRAPRSSEGCVTMSNDHLVSLMNQVKPADTLVILSRRLSFTSHSLRAQRQQQYQQLFTRFQQAVLSENKSQIAKLYATPGHSVRPHSSPTLAQYIGNMQALDITIVMNPELPAMYQNNDDRYLIMKGEFGPKNEHQFTLYWRELDNGEWRIATEVWSNPNT